MITPTSTTSKEEGLATTSAKFSQGEELFDPKVALGMFTYERPATGSMDNPAREIDLAEITRWGWDGRQRAAP
jgi:hypothetical protein